MIVVATLRAQAGKEKGLENVLTATVGPARKDHGNNAYSLLRVTDTEDEFILVEGWDSKADYDAHMASDHTAALIAALGDLLAEAPQIRICETIEAEGK